MDKMDLVKTLLQAAKVLAKDDEPGQAEAPKNEGDPEFAALVKKLLLPVIEKHYKEAVSELGQDETSDARKVRDLNRQIEELEHERSERSAKRETAHDMREGLHAFMAHLDRGSDVGALKHSIKSKIISVPEGYAYIVDELVHIKQQFDDGDKAGAAKELKSLPNEIDWDI